ncbi:MAG: VOC family protein [Labilithrix sp.]|nr:VOC family protein [Labilithrix sp.]MBX3221449.1 VOC family protein [Labilithrix sp.]
MKPTPPGWPRIASSLYYPNAAEAIDWLCRAFGFEVRVKIVDDGGRVQHSELVYGEGVVMVSEAKPERFPKHRAPDAAGGANTQNMMVYVDDVDAHCKRAREAGAKIVDEPRNIDYGPEHWEDRGYECEDPGGHGWWFYQRLRNPKT